MSAVLFDARGCLTEAGMAAFREAPPGRAPGEIAAHVASCPACQQRLLETEAPRRPAGKGGRSRPVAPSLGKTLLLAALALAAMLAALLTLRRLAGP
jgi:hypothetical protein